MGKVFEVIRYLLATIVTVAWLFPLFWWFLTSFKPYSALFTREPVYIFKPTFEWWYTVLTGIPPWAAELKKTGAIVGEAGGWFYAVPYLLNSIIIATISSILTLLASSYVAYGLSRFDFKHKSDLLFIILSFRFLPPIAVVIPYYLVWTALKLSDTHIGLIILYWIMNMGLGILLMKSYFDDIPRAIDEAAMLDGASRFKIFWRLIMPATKAGLAATFVILYLFSWDEFLMALVLTWKVARTLPVAASTYVTAYGTEWGMIAAVGNLALIPVAILSILTSRYLGRGMAMGLVKGA